MQAQTPGSPPSGTPAQTPDQTQSPTPTTPLAPPESTPLTRDPLSQAQKQQGTSSSQRSYPNEQDRIRLAREAQARVRARREQRIQATIKDTYSHKYDIYFGYTYLRIRPGHSLQHMNAYGWNAGITRYFSPRWGLTADFRGIYKNAYTGAVRSAIPEGTDPVTGAPLYGFFQGGFHPFISSYSAMAGGEYSVKRTKSYAVGVQGLAGITYNIFNANSVGSPGYLVGLYNNGTNFTAAVAMPVDFNLSPGLSIRVAPDYNLTTWGYKFDAYNSTTKVADHTSGTDIQHNLGFTAGLNYRFGRQ